MSEISHQPHSPEIDIAPKALSLDDLGAILAGRHNGVAGPERAGTAKVLDMVSVMACLDANALRWPEALPVTQDVSTTLNKLIDRAVIPFAEVTPTLPVDLAKKISQLSTLAEFPQGKEAKTQLTGLKRLILNVKTEDAKDYLSEKYVYKLQDLATDTPYLEHEIGNFFTIKELLRRMAFDRDALESTKRSVEKAVEITKDKQEYLEKILREAPDEEFVRLLSENAILTITTRSAESVDNKLAYMAKQFKKLVVDFTVLADMDSDMIFNLLLRSDPASGAQKVSERCSGIEAMIERAKSEGVTDPAVYKAIIRTTYGDIDRYDRAKLSAHRSRAISPRNTKSDGPTKRRVKGVIDRGTMPLEAYGALEQGKEYRDVLFSIDEAAAETGNKEVLSVFDEINHIKQSAEDFCNQLPRMTELSEGYAKAIEMAISKRVVELLSTLPNLIRGQECTGALYHGDTFVEDITLRSYTEVLDTIRLMRYFFDKIAKAQSGGFSETTIDPRDGIGRFVSETESVAVSVRPEQTATGEARAAWIVKITPVEQQVILGRRVTEKPTPVAMRLDYERKTGQISLDFGGMLDFVKEKQPLNAFMAQTITVGSQMVGRELGLAPENSDYHVREVFGEELADPEAFRRFVTSIMYELYIPTQQGLSEHDLGA